MTTAGGDMVDTFLHSVVILVPLAGHYRRWLGTATRRAVPQAARLRSVLGGPGTFHFSALSEHGTF